MSSELFVCADGTKRWFKDNVLHRTDGPAVEWGDGTKRWFLNGKLHRTDGPAIEDESPQWCVNGNQYTSNKSFQQAANLTDAEMAALVLKYGDVS